MALSYFICVSTRKQFSLPFLFFSINVIGIRIRVSEQDISMLVQVHEASRVLNDRLEEVRRSSHQLPELPKPADTPHDERYRSFLFLAKLLHLELEQTRLRTAHGSRILAIPLVEDLAAFVELFDDGLTFGLVVAVAREAVCGRQTKRQQTLYETGMKAASFYLGWHT
ncbi:hypothetical protein ACJZ2D_009841 [Fusarium nematophilum]